MNPSTFISWEDIEFKLKTEELLSPRVRAHVLFTESLILAQDERWRRA